jgi:hypothetical protein
MTDTSHSTTLYLLNQLYRRGPYSETNSRSASQETPSLLWSQNIVTVLIRAGHWSLLWSTSTYSGCKITENLGNVTVRGEKDRKSKGGARLSIVCLSMYIITENIYYSQLSFVVILLQSEPNCFTSYNIKKWLCFLSFCAIVFRSPPAYHVSGSNGQWNSLLILHLLYCQARCLHYFCIIHFNRPLPTHLRVAQAAYSGESYRRGKSCAHVFMRITNCDGFQRQCARIVNTQQRCFCGLHTFLNYKMKTELSESWLCSHLQSKKLSTVGTDKGINPVHRTQQSRSPLPEDGSTVKLPKRCVFI